MALPRVDPVELDQLTAALPSADWQAFAGQRVFVAGGTGFVGCWLLELLLHANERFDLRMRLSVLSREPARFIEKAPHLAADPAVTLLAGDIRDESSFD